MKTRIVILILIAMTLLLPPPAVFARYLSTDTGRFWTMDTYAGNNEDPLSLHKYLYAADDPVNNSDPSGNDYSIASVMTTISISVALVTLSGDAMAPRPIVNALPIKMVDDADIDGQLNKVFNKIEEWAKRFGPIPKESHKLWMSLMRSSQVDTIYKGYAASHYRYQYNGTEHPLLLNRTFINSDLNYIGFGEGCAARGWGKYEMDAGITAHIALDYRLLPSFNTFAAAEAGREWAFPKFNPSN